VKDDSATLKKLSNALNEFYKKRDWGKFHNPKDVAIALSIETGEILEHFRFKSNEEIEKYLKIKFNKKELSYELADVLHFLILLARVLKIDLAKSSEEKLNIAAKRYPIKYAKGNASKYIVHKKRMLRKRKKSLT
jgi:dCTP diphosphatase